MKKHKKGFIRGGKGEKFLAEPFSEEKYDLSPMYDNAKFPNSSVFSHLDMYKKVQEDFIIHKC